MELWGVLLGGVIAAVAGFFGQSFNRTSEHRQWNRDKKLEAYQGWIDEFSLFERNVSEASLSSEQRREIALRPERETAYHLMALFAPLDLMNAAADVRRKQNRLAVKSVGLLPPEGFTFELTDRQMRADLQKTHEEFLRLAAADLRRPHRRKQVLTR